VKAGRGSVHLVIIRIIFHLTLDQEGQTTRRETTQ
jgi:hypothetical protein